MSRNQTEQQFEVENGGQDEAFENTPYARIMGVGCVLAGLGSVGWSVGILAGESSNLDSLNVPSFSVLAVGLGAMAVGSTLHQRNR